MTYIPLPFAQVSFCEVCASSGSRWAHIFTMKAALAPFCPPPLGTNTYALAPPNFCLMQACYVLAWHWGAQGSHF